MSVIINVRVIIYRKMNLLCFAEETLSNGTAFLFTVSPVPGLYWYSCISAM